MKYKSCHNYLDSYFSRKLRLLKVILIVVALFGFGCAKPPEKNLQVGDIGPDFTANDINGKVVSLSKLKGQPVVMRFFVPDCKYCRADTAIFNKYYEKYKNNGLNILYLNTDPEPTEVLKFASELKIQFPVVLDSSRNIADKYRVKAVPQAIFLDPDHKIIGAILGGVSEAELDDLLKGFLMN